MARVRFIGHHGVALYGVRRLDIPRAAAASIGARVRRRVRGVARCRRGVYAVEFAQITLVLFPVLMGALEVSWQFAIAASVENAAMQAGRTASLGRKNADNTRAGPACVGDVKTAAVNAAGGFLRADRLTVKPKQYLTIGNFYSDNGIENSTGTSGSIVRWQFEYEQPVLFPFPTNALLGGNKVIHVGTTVVKNEPYPNATTTTPC